MKIDFIVVLGSLVALFLLASLIYLGKAMIDDSRSFGAMTLIFKETPKEELLILINDSRTVIETDNPHVEAYLSTKKTHSVRVPTYFNGYIQKISLKQRNGPIVAETVLSDVTRGSHFECSYKAQKLTCIKQTGGN